MANDLVAKPVSATGGVLGALLDAGLVLPTNAYTALPPELLPYGLVSDEGVTRTVDASDDKISAWGGDVVRIIRADHSVSYSLTFLEGANANLLKAIHGEENVIIDGEGIEVRHTSRLPLRRAFVFEMRDDPAAIREVVPVGQLAQTGDVAFVHTDLIRYSVTIEAFPDANGVKAYSYIQRDAYVNGVLTPPVTP
jgi:hypothetical protein